LQSSKVIYMKKIIFICHGNIFRSQIAKAIYNSNAKDGSYAESYGVAVSELGYEGKKLKDFPSLSADLEVMKRHGLDISEEICKQLHPADLEGASKIVVMTEKESVPDWLKEYNYEYWEMPNPEIVTAEITEKEFQLLKNKILGLYD
jgi:protein-tyrosine-phosphatase